MEKSKVEVIGDTLMAEFQYSHLPPHLRRVSKPFCDLAMQIVVNLKSCPERTVALRNLLLAKDAAVRCALPHNADWPPVVVPVPECMLAECRWPE